MSAALCLTALPLPLYVAVQVETGTWLDVALMLLVWAAAILLLFWLSLGSLVAAPGGWRLAAGMARKRFRRVMCG